MTTQSKLAQALDRMPTRKLETLYTIAKTRVYVFFQDPRSMIILRRVVMNRRNAEKLLKESDQK